MNIKPEKLNISLGGFGTGIYSIALKDGKLLYEATDHGTRREFISPTTKQWTQFRLALDSIRVWKWKRDYKPDLYCTDGEEWEVKVVYADTRLLSHGYMAYPKNNGMSEWMSPEFERLLKAVQVLIGGNEFNLKRISPRLARVQTGKGSEHMIQEGTIQWFYMGENGGAQPCQVKIDGKSIEISAPNTNNYDEITYRGSEVAPGHYTLRLDGCDLKGDHATVHRLTKKSSVLEGSWLCDGEEGMWRISLEDILKKAKR